MLCSIGFHRNGYLYVNHFDTSLPLGKEGRLGDLVQFDAYFSRQSN